MLYLNCNKDERDYFQKLVYDICKRTRLMDTRDYSHHFGTSVLRHSVNVAYVSYALGLRLHLNFNKKELITGALLHDYYLYDCHDSSCPDKKRHLFRHPEKALRNVREEMVISDRVADIIKKHMFPITLSPPRYKESFLVCIADKICAGYESVTNISGKMIRFSQREIVLPKLWVLRLAHQFM